MRAKTRAVIGQTPARLPRDLRGLPRATPGFIEPMKVLPVQELPQGPEWVYEIKFDGVRALALKEGAGIALVSRSANDLTSKYRELLEPIQKISARQATLDGEVVALDPQGRPSFQLLQSFQNLRPKPPLVYYVFDLLSLEGKNLASLPLSRRKALAQSLLSKVHDERLRFSAGLPAEPSRIIQELQSRGLEGLVAKQISSKYQSGRRSGAWVKFKWCNEQEFVIGGFTKPKGGRAYFGALLVGYYQGNRLLFAARVGTGFDERRLRSLHQMFQPFIRPDCPFSNLPENLPGSAKGITPAEMRRCTWIEPKLVCQVRFTEWTRDGHLRQPAFLGLREDKKPQEVVREGPK